MSYVFRVKSDPEKNDTDSDECWDNKDASPHVKNEAINYIIYGADDLTVEQVNDYERYYEKNDLDYISIQVSTYDEFVNIWKKLIYDYDGGAYSEKIAYSGVDDLCILSHGDWDSIAFSSDGIAIGDICAKSKDPLVDLLSTNIETMDIVACSCGKENSEGKCIATEFASSAKIGEVFAWDGVMRYYMGYNSCLGSQSEGYCRFYKDAKGAIQKEVIGRVIKSGTRRFEF